MTHSSRIMLLRSRPYRVDDRGWYHSNRPPDGCNSLNSPSQFEWYKSRLPTRYGRLYRPGPMIGCLSWKAVTFIKINDFYRSKIQPQLFHIELSYVDAWYYISSFNNHPLSVSTITKINVLSYHSFTEGQLDLDIQHEYHQRPHEPPHIQLIEWFCCSKYIFCLSCWSV